MTDYRKMKDQAADETKEQQRVKRQKRRGRRRELDTPLAVPPLGRKPDGGRQCPGCKRWFRRGHFGRRGGWVKFCKDCIAAGRAIRGIRSR